MDPEHYKYDPETKQRILSLATLMREQFKRKQRIATKLLPREVQYYETIDYLSSNLKINVRDKEYYNVKKSLSTLDDLKLPKKLKPLFEQTAKALEECHAEDIIGKSKSVIAVASAKNYKSEDRTVHPFSLEKDYEESMISPTIVINPHGNAFVSVYSAYENNYDPEFKIGKIGNLTKGGINRVYNTWSRRLNRWAELKDKGYVYADFHTKRFLPSYRHIYPDGTRKVKEFFADRLRSGKKKSIGKNFFKRS